MLSLGALLVALTPSPSRGNGVGATAPASVDTTVEGAGEADAVEAPRKLVKWNEYDGPVSTLRFGFGLLVDFATYAQDEASKQQVTVEPEIGLRDFRVLLRGRFKTSRPMSWTLGYMYDGADSSWRFRQTGIQIGFPELSGRVFIGRTKEGFSMIKVMVGYYGWTMERSEALDAFIPILADGVKWMGYFPKPRIFFSLGAFADYLSEQEKFATSDNQVVSRVVWQPVLSEKENRILHVGIMGRYGAPDQGNIQVRSRPELYLAPYFLNTGQFPAGQTRTAGVEAYYRVGPWLLGTEYDWQRVYAGNGERPLFHAGDIAATWLITGELHPYNAPGAFFEAVSPARTVFDGGRGALEAVLHLSYSDFDSESFQGGKFWRLTPMMNWYLSDNLRLEAVYGYGVLEQDGLRGVTQFFQGRLQTTL
jgi:phosphate-selective porin OprO and OprP